MSDMKNGLMEAIRTRRSTRSYTAEPVPEELLREIIEAGRLAPSGSNSQTTHFIVITSQEKLSELRDAVTAVLASTPASEGMPPQLLGLIERAKQGPVDVNYGAPALIITANKKGYMNADADCSCALQNMMLAANANNLGSCWINQYKRLGGAAPIRTYLEGVGLLEDEEICGALALGYAQELLREPLPRHGNPVTYV